MAGSQKVRQQREVTYEGTRRGIYSSTIVLLVGPGKFMPNTSVNDKSTSKGSAKRRQGRWKGKRPYMIIATSEGTFFTSKKEKLVEEKACISFFLFFTLRYFSCPVLTAERPEK